MLMTNALTQSCEKDPLDKFSIIRCMFVIQRIFRIRAKRHQHILVLNKLQHKLNWKHITDLMQHSQHYYIWLRSLVKKERSR